MKLKLNKNPRLRAKFKIRKKISGSSLKPRLSVFKSSKHIYAQVIDDTIGKTLASCSTLDKSYRSNTFEFSTKTTNAAEKVGSLLAEKCKSMNITTIVFDRNGYSYTGRVKAVAEGARNGGLNF